VEGKDMLIGDIARKEVLDVNANKVGYIIDADLDVARGTVSHFVLRTGVFRKLPLTPDKIDKIGEKVILKITRDSLEGKLTGAMTR